MPVQQGRRRDQEDVPVRSGEDATRRGEEDTVGVAELRSAHLAPQDRELMAQHHELEVLIAPGTEPQRHQLQDSTHQHVND